MVAAATAKRDSVSGSENLSMFVNIKFSSRMFDIDYNKQASQLYQISTSECAVW